MQKVNVKGALKLFTNEMSNGILPLTEETLSQLEVKHPDNGDASADVFINGPVKEIHPIVFEAIDEEMVLIAASITKGGSGSSGLDADGWRRILTSNSLGAASSNLRKSLEDFIKRLCSKRINSQNKLLEAFIACRLIPLNENPGLSPINAGEVLRRIAGKVVMKILKKDVMHAPGSLQLCAGQEAGAKAVIRAMTDIYNDKHSEAVLLVDAENLFNSINRNVMIHNVSVVCPAISTYVSNCYQSAARLFVIGGKEVSLKEVTTQSDPTSMGTHALGMTPLLPFLHEFILINEHRSKEVTCADDLTVARKIEEIKQYWELLLQVGPKYGYCRKPSKSHLIVKEEHFDRAKFIFKGSEVKITISGWK